MLHQTFFKNRPGQSKCRGLRWLPVFVLLLLLLLEVGAQAQDTILLVNGTEIRARVREITPEDISYLPPDSAQGPTLVIPRREVFMITFANGTKEVFPENLPENQPLDDTAYMLAETPEQMYRRGQQDARIHYTGTGALLGSAGLALIFPYGLAGVAVIGAVPPKAAANQVPDVRLLQNPAYVSGYERQAHRKKIGKAALGAGVGTLTILVVAVAAFASFY